jgi:aldehyde dehydrogenase (NAD+)
VLAPLVARSPRVTPWRSPSEVSAETSRTLARLLPRTSTRTRRGVEGVTRRRPAGERWDHISTPERDGRARDGRGAQHLTPVTLELGGKSPVIVDASADLDVTAKRIVWASS